MTGKKKDLQFTPKMIWRNFALVGIGSFLTITICNANDFHSENSLSLKDNAIPGNFSPIPAKLNQDALFHSGSEETNKYVLYIRQKAREGLNGIVLIKLE